jgi:hypothetical protein
MTLLLWSCRLLRRYSAQAPYQMPQRSSAAIYMLDLRRSAYCLVLGHQLGFRFRAFVFNNAMYAMPMPTRKEQLREQEGRNRKQRGTGCFS